MGWRNGLLSLWDRPTGNIFTATGSPKESEHLAFYDRCAIQATINAIHNLCLAEGRILMKG
jgi:hypothetical protein